jgi:hypothetical protein
MRRWLGLLVVFATTPALETQSFAANQDGVPLSPDAMIAGTTIASHDGGTGAWYNPSALGGIPRSSVQVSTSIYTLSIRTIDGFTETRLPWETRRNSLSATDFTTVPSGISFVFKLGERFGLSLGLFSPVREYGSFDSQLTSISPDGMTRYTQSAALTQRLDATHGGIGFGWAITDRFRIGAMALLTQDSAEEVVDSSFQATQGMNFLFVGSITRVQANYFGFRGVVGAQLDAAKWLSLGLAVRSPTIGFAASGKQVSTIYGGLGPSTLPASGSGYQQIVTDAKPATLSAPTRIYWAAQATVGRARIALEGDVRHPIDDPGCGTTTRCTTGADKWVVNGRAGAIVQATDNIWIGGGFFTDMDGHDLAKSGQTVDYFGGTAGLQFRSPSVVKLRAGGDPWDLRTTVAIRYAAGIGQSQSEILDLNMLKILANPQPGSILFHELSLNIGTALEF